MPQPNPTPRLEPQLRRVTNPDSGDRVELSGPWILRALEAQLNDLSRQLADYARDTSRHWDLTGVTRLDHTGAVLLWRAWGGQRVAHLTLRPEHEALFTGLAVPRQRPPHPGFDWRQPVAVIGEQLFALRDHLLQFVQLIGRIIIDGARLLRHPADLPSREISAGIYRAGA